MIDRLNVIEERYNEINEELLKPEILNDYNSQMNLFKEKSSLEETFLKYQDFKTTTAEIEGLKEMLKDSDMGELATSELEVMNEKLERLTKELELLLIPKDENDGKDIIMEIRGAAGGDEANIFAGDLFRMYSKYAEKEKWQIEVINATEGTSGGFTLIEFSIAGNNVYSKLKFESGAHRVQRVPETETQGRVHTSTATVVVMPEAEETQVEIKSDDIRVDVYRASGKGGQGVNTTDSAVRLTHIPTGIVVTCQNERSQIKNKERAMKVLKAKIYDQIIQEEEQKNSQNRKNKIGTGDRSEKIRTYNYAQNRVTDHRINFSIMELDGVMEGNLESVIEALITEDQKRKLSGEV